MAVSTEPGLLPTWLPDAPASWLARIGFFEAYWNGNAPADWPRREALFQLYPLLNHLLLFGTTYRSGVQRCVVALERYQDL